MRAHLVAADVNEVVDYHLEDAEALFDGAVAEQLLEQVVAVLVFHDLCHVVVHLQQEEFDQLWRRLDQLLLQVPRAYIAKAQTSLDFG